MQGKFSEFSNTERMNLNIHKQRKARFEKKKNIYLHFPTVKFIVETTKETKFYCKSYYITPKNRINK